MLKFDPSLIYKMGAGAFEIRRAADYPKIYWVEKAVLPLHALLQDLLFSCSPLSVNVSKEAGEKIYYRLDVIKHRWLASSIDPGRLISHRPEDEKMVDEDWPGIVNDLDAFERLFLAEMKSMNFFVGGNDDQADVSLKSPD